MCKRRASPAPEPQVDTHGVRQRCDRGDGAGARVCVSLSPVLTMFKSPPMEREASDAFQRDSDAGSIWRRQAHLSEGLWDAGTEKGTGVRGWCLWQVKRGCWIPA